MADKKTIDLLPVVHYGPHGESNRANPSKTKYAEQKAGILPNWTMVKSQSNEEPEKEAEGGLIHRQSNKRKFAAGGRALMMADGGAAALPPGFELEGAAPAATLQPQQLMQQQSTPGLPPGFELEASPEEQYGTPGQQAITGLEGAGSGVITAPGMAALERGLGVSPEAIRMRQEVNPWAHGLGETAGLAGSMFTGVGEAAGLAKVGEAASAITGLAKAGEAASFGAKVGDAAVRSAAEMAVLGGSDEAAKVILQDPNQTAQSAMANIGLSAVFGGITGGALGTVSPLWKATIGPAVEEKLEVMKSVLNGSKHLTPKTGIEESIKGLDIGDEITPLEKALLSEEGHLALPALERDRPEVLEAIEGIHDKVANSVVESAGVHPDDVMEYDKAFAGNQLKDNLVKEVKNAIEPIEVKLNAHEAENAHIEIPDEARLDHFGRMVERGMTKFTPTSEYADLYSKYGQQLLDAENVSGVQKIESELGGKIRGLSRGGAGVDQNIVDALRDIRDMTREYKYNSIEKSISSIAGGAPEATGLATEKIASQRAALNEYRQAAQLMEQMQDHFDLGHFAGKMTLANKINSLSGEQAMRKLSFKNNMEAISFLQQNFPNTFEAIRKNEVREFLKPSMMSGAKKGTALDIKRLESSIASTQAGNATYLRTILPQETLMRAAHARTVLDSLPDLRSSKTAKWTEKLMAHLPASALAAVQFLLGRNPLSGIIIGEMTSRLQQNLPDAIKLSYLKWLGTDAPIQSGAFKSMVDTINHALKYQANTQSAVKAVFKAAGAVGTKALAEVPSENDRNKLDKQITKYQQNPTIFAEHQAQSQLGHYMPETQGALTTSSTQALKYLQTLKPQPHVTGILDKQEPPLPLEHARYDRALNIAIHPNIVLQRIKDGTLQISDIADLHNMYPALYQNMTNLLTQEMTAAQSKGVNIPYRTRIALSTFLGQPLDTTMQPMSIQAAQPMPIPMPAMQGGAKGKTRKGTSTLGKSNSSYQTADQSAEGDRGNRE